MRKAAPSRATAVMLGGVEFVVLLSDTAREEARQWA
ncbi:hypothetical protein ACQP1P_45580 [Dactylosporangium sp. CA-052675]